MRPVSDTWPPDFEVERRPRQRDVAASGPPRSASTGCRCSSNSATTGTPVTRGRRVALERDRRPPASAALPPRRRSRTPRPSSPPNALPARALSRWPSIAASKPSRSTVDALRRRRVLDEVVRACRTCRRAGTPPSPGSTFDFGAERLGELRLEPRQAVGQHRVEAVLLGEDRLLDHLAVARAARDTRRPSRDRARAPAGAGTAR